MKLVEMIAARKRLTDEIAWHRRVVVVGDQLAKEHSQSCLESDNASLAWLESHIKRAEEKKLARERRVVMIALWVCIALESALAGWGLWHYWHVLKLAFSA
jgi:hypothetical protein